MSNPPMEWGYPRTPEGFFHALTRGQYDKINPTDIFQEPGKFIIQIGMLFVGLADAYSWVFMFIAVLPIFFLLKMQKRERAWIIAVAAIYPFLGILLTIFLDPTPERQTADLVKVFYTASHADVAIMIGYGFGRHRRLHGHALPKISPLGSDWRRYRAHPRPSSPSMTSPPSTSSGCKRELIWSDFSTAIFPGSAARPSNPPICPA